MVGRGYDKGWVIVQNTLQNSLTDATALARANYSESYRAAINGKFELTTDTKPSSFSISCSGIYRANNDWGGNPNAEISCALYVNSTTATPDDKYLISDAHFTVIRIS